MPKVAVSCERVAIPGNLFDAVARYIRKNPQLGYVSVSEFAREALRDYIKEHRKL